MGVSRVSPRRKGSAVTARQSAGVHRARGYWRQPTCSSMAMVSASVAPFSRYTVAPPARDEPVLPADAGVPADHGHVFGKHGVVGAEAGCRPEMCDVLLRTRPIGVGPVRAAIPEEEAVLHATGWIALRHRLDFLHEHIVPANTALPRFAGATGGSHPDIAVIFDLRGGTLCSCISQASRCAVLRSCSGVGTCAAAG